MEEMNVTISPPVVASRLRAVMTTFHGISAQLPQHSSDSEEDGNERADMESRTANIDLLAIDNTLKAKKLDPRLIGMSVGYKSLYAGREDRRGRFQWQDTIPDVVKPAENAETQKWALVVRYVKEYTDPRKVLAIHSIVVQSPLLKQVLETVLADYPGVTVSLQRLEFSGRFESLIHRFPELNAEIARLKKELEGRGDVRDVETPVAGDLLQRPSEEVAEPEIRKQSSDAIDETDKMATLMTEKEVSYQELHEHLDEMGNHDSIRPMTNADTTLKSSSAHSQKHRGTVEGIREMDIDAEDGELYERGLKLRHAELLRDVLFGEFQSVIESSQDMKGKGAMTYDYLWTLFEPGHLVYCRQEGQDRVFRLQSARYGHDRENHPVFWVVLSYIDFDGTKFGWTKTKISMSPFQGTRAITSLAAYPLESHGDVDGLKAKLIERGSRIENFSGTHYRAYEGIGWRMDQWGQKERHSINGRIIIDAVGWNRYQPNHAIFVNRLDSKDAGRDPLSTRILSLPSEMIFDDCGGDFGGMPLDGHFEGEEDDQNRKQPLSDDQKLLCTHLLRGYALKEKIWLNLFVNSVQDITFNSRAFESLVLPENQKELILGFTCTQQAYRTSYDDVIQGKGRGIILLLCGPPGVGKTLTAESVAEEMKVPLFVMSAGDLGMDSKTIEARLLSILGMCTRWNAVLLLDEADIFLEERSLHEVERNKLVSIFLRVLEYHEGIMFLTTNRVQTFDPAFQSRIHISIDYPELSVESRRTVWEKFLQQHDATQAAARASLPKDPASSIKSATEAPDEGAARRVHEAMTQPHRIETREIKELARVQLNGRQIKNVLKTAQLLATHKKEALSHSHVATVLDVTQHLHNASQATKRAQGSIYH